MFYNSLKNVKYIFMNLTKFLLEKIDNKEATILINFFNKKSILLFDGITHTLSTKSKNATLKEFN